MLFTRKTYLKYYGIIGEKLISRNDHWHNLFIKLFKYYYDIIENFETNSLRNLGKFSVIYLLRINWH